MSLGALFVQYASSKQPVGRAPERAEFVLVGCLSAIVSYAATANVSRRTSAKGSTSDPRESIFSDFAKAVLAACGSGKWSGGVDGLIKRYLKARKDSGDTGASDTTLSDGLILDIDD
jgi:hypothetical protein